MVKPVLARACLGVVVAMLAVMLARLLVTVIFCIAPDLNINPEDLYIGIVLVVVFLVVFCDQRGR